MRKGRSLRSILSLHFSLLRAGASYLNCSSFRPPSVGLFLTLIEDAVGKVEFCPHGFSFSASPSVSYFLPMIEEGEKANSVVCFWYREGPVC